VEIDLSVLRLMEREREIPFDELVVIIEQAILTAYLKHTSTAESAASAEHRGSPEARVELDRKTGRVHIFIPELNEEGDVIGEAEDIPEDFGRVGAFAAKQVINQRLRDIGDDKVLGEFKGR
jgi:N utilization substance protein A